MCSSTARPDREDCDEEPRPVDGDTGIGEDGGSFAAGLRSLVRNRSALVLCAVVFLSSVPVFAHLAEADSRLYSFNDHPGHLEQAALTSILPARIHAPHPTYHLVVRSVSYLMPLEVASVLVLSVATTATAAILFCWARRPSRLGPGLSSPAAAGVVLFIHFMETPVAALNALDVLNPAQAFAGSKTWASPTDVIVLPMALALISVGVRFAAEEGPAWYRPTRVRWQLALTSFAVMMTKPAAALALVPALGLYLVATRALSWRRLAATGLWCAMPVALLAIWQAWFTRNSEASHSLGYTDYGLTVDPFRYVQFLGFGLSGPWYLFWLMLAPVVLAIWAGGRRFLTHPPVAYVLCGLPGTLFLALGLSETNVPVDGQDLLRPLVFCVLPLLYLSVIAVAQRAVALQQTRTSSSLRQPWIPVAAVVALMWCFGGILLYLDAAGLSSTLPTSRIY